MSYAAVPRGALKLKRASDAPSDSKIVKKRSKTRSKQRQQQPEDIDAQALQKLTNEEVIQLEKSRRDQLQTPTITKTKAEAAFQKRQEELQMKRVLKKAEKSHKERVDTFNANLDKLTEHYDIPKVSWTK